MFLVHQINGSHAWEEMPCSAIVPEVGKAMTVTGGKLAVASGTTKPTYICMRHEASTVAAGTPVPVMRIRDDMIFETTFSVAATSIKIGDKLTLSTDGMQVTATTTDGVAEVVEIIENTAGGHVRVRFA